MMRPRRRFLTLWVRAVLVASAFFAIAFFVANRLGLEQTPEWSEFDKEHFEKHLARGRIAVVLLAPTTSPFTPVAVSRVTGSRLTRLHQEGQITTWKANFTYLQSNQTVKDIRSAIPDFHFSKDPTLLILQKGRKPVSFFSVNEQEYLAEIESRL